MGAQAKEYCAPPDASSFPHFSPYPVVVSPGLRILHGSAEALHLKGITTRSARHGCGPHRRARARRPAGQELPHVQGYPRQAGHHRLRSGRMHRRDLCGARDARTGHDPRRAGRRPAHHHHRRRELSGLRRGDPGPLADGADGEAGRACRHAARRRPCDPARPVAAPVPAGVRLRRGLPRRRGRARDRRAGALARSSLRAEIQGLRRVGLRDLRWLLLSRQGSAGDRRRKHRGRGGAVPHQFRLQGHGRAPARPLPRGENPAGPPVQESQDRRHLGRRAA